MDVEGDKSLSPRDYLLAPFHFQVLYLPSEKDIKYRGKSRIASEVLSIYLPA